MANLRKSRIKNVLAFATFVLAGAYALYGLWQWTTWYLSLPNSFETPTIVFINIARTFVQLVACIIGITAVVRQRYLWLFTAIFALFAVNVADWIAMSVSLAASGTPLFELHIRPLLLSLWLVTLAAWSVPNNSFKPKPLRGSA